MVRADEIVVKAIETLLLVLGEGHRIETNFDEERPSGARPPAPSVPSIIQIVHQKYKK